MNVQYLLKALACCTLAMLLITALAEAQNVSVTDYKVPVSQSKIIYALMR